MTDTLQPLVELVGAPPVEQQIADYLQQLLPPGRPRRVARMSKPGELKREYDHKAKRYTGRMVPRDKYEDIGGPLTRAMLVDHAAGVVTYSCTLDQAGHSRAGAIDIDQGGQSAVKSVLSAAQKAGLWCYGIVLEGDDHSGGHVIFPYFLNVPVKDICAQLAGVVAAAGLPVNTEIWPQNQGIRLPLGYHQTKGTRGQLLTQAGEVVDLDTDLAGGLDLVTSLQPNAAPPMLPTDPTPKKAAAQTADKVHYTIRRESPGERAAGRASLDDVRQRFNAEHTIASVLDRWGKATETRDGFACDCGVGHTHETTLYISKRGRLFSYSPRCHLHTTKGWDAFGLEVFLFHNNNVVAAAKELNPIQPRQRSQEAPQHATVYRTAEMDADAERKRAERRAAADERIAAAAETLAEIQARASQDSTLSGRAQLVLLALLETAGTRDWTRASVARLAELTELCERYVHEGLRELERGAYISSGRRNGSTTIRTLLRLHGYVNRADESRLLACEGGANLPAYESVYPPTLPDWQLAKVGALGAMDDAAFATWFSSHNFTPKKAEILHNPTPEKGETEQNGTPKSAPCSQGETGLQQIAVPKKGIVLNTEAPEQNAVEPVFVVSEGGLKSQLPAGWVLRCSGPFLYASDGEWSTKPSSDASAVIAAAWLLVEPSATRCNTKKETIQDSSTQKSAFVHNPTRKPKAEQPNVFQHHISRARQADSADNNDYTNTGAEYTPVDLASHKPYTGTPRALLSFDMRAALALEAMRLLPDAGQLDQAEQLPLEAHMGATPLPIKVLAQDGKSRVIDRYLVELAGMSGSELAGELRKHNATLKKHSGATWLSGIRDRLVLVEREIDARDMAGVPIAPRSQAHTPSYRVQGEQSPLWAA